MLCIQFVINPISLAPFWKILPIGSPQLLYFTAFLTLSILSSPPAQVQFLILLKIEQEKRKMEVKEGVRSKKNSKVKSSWGQ
jgi:hypothetical protein